MDQDCIRAARKGGKQRFSLPAPAKGRPKKSPTGNSLIVDSRRVQGTHADYAQCSDIFKIILAVILPPLGVFLERGCGVDLLINVGLTCESRHAPVLRAVVCACTASR